MAKITVEQLIEELSKIKNKKQPCKIRVSSDPVVFNDITIEVNDGWPDGYSQVELLGTLNYKD